MKQLNGWLAVIITSAAASSLAFAGSAGAKGPSERPSWCEPNARGEYDADQMPSRFRKEDCNVDGAVIRRGAVRVETPRPGSAVLGEALGGAGVASTTILSVSSSTDGTYEVGEGALAGSQASGSPSDCSDPTQGNGTAYKMRNVLNYGINTGTFPSNISSTNGVNAIRNALTGLLSHANDCGESRDPNAPGLNYTGATTSTVNFGADAVCPNTQDNSHVILFGGLPTEFVAYTCFTYDGAGTLTHFDMRLSTGRGWDYTLTDGCSGWDITGVMTHEFGHVYGISHVDESTHGNLTMSSDINGDCQVSERTLGRGDMDHMFAKYGVK